MKNANADQIIDLYEEVILRDCEFPFFGFGLKHLPSQFFAQVIRILQSTFEGMNVLGK